MAGNLITTADPLASTAKKGYVLGMPAGRPTKYDEAYCDGIVAFADGGRSLSSYAAKIGVSRSTIQEWEKQHPEFSVAASIARAKIAAWWEDQAIDIAENGGNSTRGTLVIFGLKNMARDDWQEKLSLVGGDDTDAPIQMITRRIVDPAKPEAE